MVLRQSLLRVSADPRVRQAVTRASAGADLVDRFVAGQTQSEVLAVARELAGKGLLSTADVLGEDTTDESQAAGITATYVELLAGIAESGLSEVAEVSVKLTAVGLGLGRGGEDLALANARAICQAADLAGTTVTIDMEQHTMTDATLAIVAALRQDHPDTGAVLQAYLKRTESDVRELRGPGSRVRLCKGAYDEDGGVAYSDRREIDRSYVRCLRLLMEGEGYPMVASHDPRLIAIATKLVELTERDADSYEFQMLYGIRPLEQRRLVDTGHRMRVYLPYGTDWYGYFVRRVAEKPSTALFLARQLVSRR